VTALGAVVLLSTAAAGLGHAVLGDASGTVTGAVQAVAAGALPVMLVDSMVPEATRDGGPTVGLVTVLGFAVAVLLSQA
jgi:ZIP family zinc transporter